MIFNSKSPKQTQEFAAKTAQKIIKKLSKKAVVIALEGELGAGKTTFIQGFCKGLKIKAKIKSPTFVLMKKYQIATSDKRQATKYLYHFDCYRLRDYKDLISLDIEEIIEKPENIVLIEWAERVREILPSKHIKIHIDHIDKNRRKITFKS